MRKNWVKQLSWALNSKIKLHSSKTIRHCQVNQNSLSPESLSSKLKFPSITRDKFDPKELASKAMPTVVTTRQGYQWKQNFIRGWE